MKILVFAFAGTVAQNVAMLFESDHQIMLASSRNALDLFVATTDFSAYDLVLGLGAYNGRDHNALRIESECSSRFRNKG